MFKPSSNVTDRSKAWLLCGSLFYQCFMFVFVMLSCLFLEALWSPAGKRLTYWPYCVLCFRVFLSLSNIILIHIRLRVRLVSLIMFKPSSNFDKLGVFHANKHLWRTSNRTIVPTVVTKVWFEHLKSLQGWRHEPTGDGRSTVTRVDRFPSWYPTLNLSSTMGSRSSTMGSRSVSSLKMICFCKINLAERAFWSRLFVIDY